VRAAERSGVGADGLKAVVIGLAAEQSIREKRVVEIDGLMFR
jgi:hypothetical protein